MRGVVALLLAAVAGCAHGYRRLHAQGNAAVRQVHIRGLAEADGPPDWVRYNIPEPCRTPSQLGSYGAPTTYGGYGAYSGIGYTDDSAAPEPASAAGQPSGGDVDGREALVTPWLCGASTQYGVSSLTQTQVGSPIFVFSLTNIAWAASNEILTQLQLLYADGYIQGPLQGGFSIPGETLSMAAIDPWNEQSRIVAVGVCCSDQQAWGLGVQSIMLRTTKPVWLGAPCDNPSVVQIPTGYVLAGIESQYTSPANWIHTVRFVVVTEPAMAPPPGWAPPPDALDAAWPHFH